MQTVARGFLEVYWYPKVLRSDFWEEKSVEVDEYLVLFVR